MHRVALDTHHDAETGWKAVALAKAEMVGEGRAEAAAAQHEAAEPAVYAERAAIDELGTSESELHLYR